MLHHKQIRPANVHGYSSGINRATDRLLTALEASRNKEGYVDDIYPHVINWTMEGNRIYYDWLIEKKDSVNVCMCNACSQDLFCACGLLLRDYTTNIRMTKISVSSGKQSVVKDSYHQRNSQICLWAEQTL